MTINKKSDRFYSILISRTTPFVQRWLHTQLMGSFHTSILITHTNSANHQKQTRDLIQMWFNHRETLSHYISTNGIYYIAYLFKKRKQIVMTSIEYCVQIVYCFSRLAYQSLLSLAGQNSKIGFKFQNPLELCTEHKYKLNRIFFLFCFDMKN